jgi:hypothetical protein
MKLLNMNRVSLYYTLNTNFPDRKLNKEERQFLLDKMKTLTKEQKEACTLLIFEHSKERETIPYKGVQTETQLSFKLISIPDDLKWILYKFAKII